MDKSPDDGDKFKSRDFDKYDLRQLYNDTHKFADTDVERDSIHHTLGTRATQAARGDHLHDDSYSKIAHGHIYTSIEYTSGPTTPTIPNTGLQYNEYVTPALYIPGVGAKGLNGGSLHLHTRVSVNAVSPGNAAGFWYLYHRINDTANVGSLMRQARFHNNGVPALNFSMVIDYWTILPAASVEISGNFYVAPYVNVAMDAAGTSANAGYGHWELTVWIFNA